MFRTSSIAVSCLVATLSAATAFGATDLEQRIEAFHANPKAVMEMNPIKKDAKGRVLPAGSESRFSANDVRSNAYVEKKMSYRLGTAGDVSGSVCNSKGVCLKDILEGRAATQERVEDFLDMREFRAKNVRPTASLAEMESKGLLEAKLDETPWSDTYWPISQGILGARYSNKKYAYLGHNWKAHFDLLSKKEESLAAIYRSGDKKQIDALSPSEKYDLLIGDLTANGRVYEQGYLTPSQWSEGEGYYRSQGKVETWMGICHGWAPAAYMVPRPQKSITVKAADGKTDIKFYPSDMKGLVSYAWAKANVTSAFLGGRCNTQNPAKDPQTGRNTSPECFDTNPGNWHVAVVNQIGLAKRSFVIDATYDYEVWNQPVYSYKYRYFNPQTGKEVKTLQEATVAVDDFTKDKFKRFRARNTKFVVGIEMDLAYGSETSATVAETDSSQNDSINTVSYMYDLELDANGAIIGGEWYSNGHPDFLWSPPSDAHAASSGDRYIRNASEWKVGEPLPKFWRDIAIQTAVRYQQPLISILEPLVKAANDAPAPAPAPVVPDRYSPPPTPAQ